MFVSLYLWGAMRTALKCNNNNHPPFVFWFRRGNAFGYRPAVLPPSENSLQKAFIAFTVSAYTTACFVFFWLLSNEIRLPTSTKKNHWIALVTMCCRQNNKRNKRNNRNNINSIILLPFCEYGHRKRKCG